MLNSFDQDALSIFQSALDASSPREAVLRFLGCQGDALTAGDWIYDLKEIRRIIVVGFGKAGVPMALAVEEVLGDRISDEIILVKTGHGSALGRGICLEGTHPVLSAANLEGTMRLVSLLQTAQSDDLVVCLISGGGSALLEWPADGLSLEDLQQTTSVLLRSGAPVSAINTIRKHLSKVKGGLLSRHVQGATVISLILSDVVGSPIDQVASGPMAPDPTTFSDALSILDQYHLRDQVPAVVLEHLRRGARGELEETPKEGDPLFGRVRNIIIADNALACEAALRCARSLGYQTFLWSSQVEGEARAIARDFALLAHKLHKAVDTVSKPICVIAGGETTVTVQGDGLGGRNQEMALAFAVEVEGLSKVVFLCAGTDGTDGPTEAAGALVDGSTVPRGRLRDLDADAYLANNDSHRFFRALGDLVTTGPTKTNVNDLMVLIVCPLTCQPTWPKLAMT